MPAKSKAQQRLMAAAEHGATFPLARKVRRSMTKDQLRDFASGSMKGKPVHVTAARTTSPPGDDGASVALRVRARLHPHANLGTYLHPAKAQK